MQVKLPTINKIAEKLPMAGGSMDYWKSHWIEIIVHRKTQVEPVKYIYFSYTHTFHNIIYEVWKLSLITILEKIINSKKNLGRKNGTIVQYKESRNSEKYKNFP